MRGFLINKFRGDVSLFDDGLATITQHTGWRSHGVVPWLSGGVETAAGRFCGVGKGADGLR